MMRASSLLVLATLAAGCGESEDYVLVTVEGRPAVHDVAKLRVTLSNGGTSRSDDLVLDGQTLPSTFTITAPGRTGELGISIDAFDAADALVGRGTIQSALDQSSVKLMLDSTDFVVNTEVAQTQELSNYTRSNGFQLAASRDRFMAAFTVSPCSPSCNMFGRAFDATGKVQSTQVAAGTNQFPLNTDPTTFFSTPALAANSDSTLAIWNQYDPSPATTRSIQCRTFDVNGGANPFQKEIATDENPDVVSVAALGNQNYAVVWDGTLTTQQIRSAIVRSDCTVVQLNTVQTAAGTPHGSSIAAAPDRIMYAWIVDGGVHMRIASNGNAFLTNDLEIIKKTPTESVEHVRVASAAGGGFVVAVRWALDAGAGPSRLEIYRTTNLGAISGQATLVTDKTGSEFAQSQGFGVASNTNGTTLVVWHGCDQFGDGAGCGVFGRAFAPDGTPSGEPFVLATTTMNDQTGPSVAAMDEGFAVAWTDLSTQPPDTSESSVRARVVYPPGSTPSN